MPREAHETEKRYGVILADPPWQYRNKGNANVPDGHFLGLLSERFQHSRKPNNIYAYCEQFPGPYLEMFARRTWPGWDVWGNEVDCDVELTA